MVKPLKSTLQKSANPGKGLKKLVHPSTGRLPRRKGPRKAPLAIREFRAGVIKNLRQAYMEVFEAIGGIEAFALWAAKSNKNQTEFYKQLSKMLPRDIVVGDSNVAPNDLSNLTEQELDAVIADSFKSR